MSGIAAILNSRGPAVDKQLIIDMAQMMSLRGPKTQQYWHSDTVAMAHTLLPTTLQSANENQPSTLDGKVWLTADIRIDAREELIKKVNEHQFTINSQITDDQLFLHAYRIWGVNCLQHIIGDFAFILWDSTNQRLLCATDQFGVAPLYYATTSHGLCVSNTLNAIRLHPDSSNQLDEIAIADYLLFRINENSHGTFFEHIKHLPAGHCLIHENNTFQIKQYWSLEPRGDINHKAPGTYLEEFESLLTRAVSDRTRTDSVAVHLSGGMDSSSVTALTHSLMRSQHTPNKIQAYTYGANGTLPDLESPYATEIAEELGIKHHILKQLVDEFDHDSAPTELRSPEPRFTSRETSNYKLLRHVTSHSSVLLTGYGGDPLLRAQALNWQDLNSPRKLFSMLGHLQQHWAIFGQRPTLGLKQRFGSPTSNNMQHRTLPDWISPIFSNKHSLLERFNSILEVKTKPYTAQFSMTNGGLWRRIFCWNDPGFTHIPVKVLHPFFDTRLLNYAQSLPPFPWLYDKTILRQSMRQHLPNSVIQRPKTPLPGNGLQSVLSTRSTPTRFNKLLDNQQLTNYVDTSLLKATLNNSNTSTKADFKAIIRVTTLSDWLIGYEKVPLSKNVGNSNNVKRIN